MKTKNRVWLRSISDLPDLDLTWTRPGPGPGPELDKNSLISSVDDSRIFNINNLKKVPAFYLLHVTHGHDVNFYQEC